MVVFALILLLSSTLLINANELLAENQLAGMYKYIESMSTYLTQYFRTTVSVEELIINFKQLCNYYYYFFRIKSCYWLECGRPSYLD